MLSILVCHSYFLRFDTKQAERAKPYPPLATLQVAALLRQIGHEVSLFDAMLASGVEEYDRKVAAVKPQLVLFYEDNYNFLSKMCLGKMRRAACRMIQTARRQGSRVIAAGADVSDAPEPYLQAGADLALIGEGLSALLQLLPRLESAPHAHGEDLARGIRAVAALKDGRVCTNSTPVTPGPGFVPAGPNHIESTAWDLVDMERYRSVWMRSHGYFSLNMAASRGCSFRCNWCAKPIWGNQYLQRDATAVALEMAHLRSTFDADHVWFADDIFGFRVDWVAKFASAAAAAGGSIPFTIQTRADLASERMALALRDAGCKEAWIGAESGSQRVLDSMNKGTTVREIVTARSRLQAAGIRVGFFIQLGYLGEQLTDIVATRELLSAAKPDDVGVSVSYPLPGTRFHELVKAQLGAQTRWQDSNDLAMMFRGTYTSDFYRAVRNLLHDQVTLQNLEGGGHTSELQGQKRALEQRWQVLLAQESQYRSQDGPAAAAV
jgi:anaerobic magnesium-protoporphyrin IX monomethyl ester cyclase